MVLNIMRYQLPYIEYDLFKNYIAENLCVKKDVPDNNCQGHCFLEKQINRASEMENALNNPVKEKQIQWNTNDYIKTDALLQMSVLFIKIQLPSLAVIHITKMGMDVPCPPPKNASQWANA
ncbi:MAG: hypothetical protein EZS26_003371 [Candidatus Ordinivivax streblomastigis]|uniref:Uncharacterized protein n=1 Tax=Candidatus Ordinivivax streblomastigis TaxID=2540710 RepID=A0A5M8NTU5_9BACT|nr:MAG: hypothetical protein EZS26_003371 [Candidatus Ordinivivax streblomastigis]